MVRFPVIWRVWWRWVAPLATAPNIGVAIAANAVVEGSFFLLIPGIYAVLSLAVPAKVRAFGFAVGTLWILLGAAPARRRQLADTYGIRWGLIAASRSSWSVPSSSPPGTRSWSTTSSRCGVGRRPLEVALLRRQGKVKLLLCRTSTSTTTTCRCSSA